MEKVFADKVMKILIILCIISTVNLQTLYDLWRRDQKKIYYSQSKIKMRRRVFEENMNLISSVNFNKFNNYQLELNRFADIPFQYFADKYLGIKLPNQTKLREEITYIYPTVSMRSITPILRGLLGNFTPDTAPAAVDYRKYSLAVQNQLECGSCYAISALGVIGKFF